MMAMCSTHAAEQLGASPSDIAAGTYEGSRTDGAHAVNGNTTAGQTFQCSFNAAGTHVAGWSHSAAQGCPADVSEADRYRYLRRAMLRSILFTTALALLQLSPAQIALAQMSEEVKFRAGDSGAVVSGKVTGQDYVDYRLGARAGQKLFAELTVTGSDGDGTVYFNILPPGSADVAIYNGSIDGNAATMPLPETGTYTIRVYQMGNDEDTGKTSAYNLDLSIQ